MPAPRRPAFRLSPLAAAATVALVWATTLILVQSQGFWVTDDANKFLHVQALAGSGWSDFSIPWPGRAVAPDFRFVPLPAPYAQVDGGKLWSQYPPLFAAITAAPFRLLGFPGLYLLPFAGALATIAAVAKLGRALGLDDRTRAAAILAVGLATPLWFYAVAFWEHAIVLGLLTFASWLTLDPAHDEAPRRHVLGWALAAMSIAFREDAMVLAGALVAVHGLSAPRRRLLRLVVAGAWVALLVLPLLAFQHATVGHALGHHVAGNLTSLADHLRARPLVLYRQLVAAGPGLAASILLVGPLALGLIAQPAISPRAFRLAVPLLAALATAASLAMLAGLATRSPIVQLLRSNSLFPAAPWIAIAIVRLRRDGPPTPDLDGRLRAVVALYTLGYLVATPSNATGTGIHWGNRFLLVLYPLLGVLAAKNLATWGAQPDRAARAHRAIVGLVIAVSLVAQLASVGLLGLKRDFSFRLNDELARWPDVPVVTDVWWAGHELWRDFAARPTFLVRSAAEIDDLDERLRAAGHREVVFVTAPSRQAPGPGVVEIDDGGLRFFTLTMGLRSTAPRAFAP